MDRIDTPRRDTGPETVAGILRQHAEDTPEALAYRFLTITGEESWTYRELDRRARTVAAHLQRENLKGRPVLLLHPPGLEYIANFLGCLYAGAIAVPAYPPDTARFGQTLPRLAAIARDARATHALTTGTLARFAESRHAEIAELGLGELCWLATDGFDDTAAEWRDPGATGGTLAFLQYTSGSTSTPKGVMVSNENLVANLRAIHLRLEHDRDSVMVSWLPPYHDMGLIGGILSPLYGGFPAHLMAPMTFVQRPLLWLETISTTRASTAIAPNFGFDYCLRRITPEQRDNLDLSHWRLALNGAEPVRADTLERFADHFTSCGFDRRALSPCYGLAEATLIVTGVRASERPSVTALATGPLESGSVEPARGTERTTQVVGCGPVADSVDVAIVDPRTGRRADGDRVGEIWVSGPSVARGYWRRPEDTRETFHARIDGEGDTRYLRTGDLGFERNGELHVVGRTKDVVIVQGRNHYPQDVELTVEKAGDVIRANNGAAFGVQVDGAEELVVAYEVDGRLLEDADALLARLRTAIAEEHEVSPHAVVLLKRSAVRKTTSGKIQRQACKQAFLGFELPVVAASVVREFGEPGPAGAADRTGVAAAVAEVLGGTGGGFADLGLDYPRLLDAVRTLERRFGTRVPIGPLLADPRPDTLVTLLGGGQTGEEASPAAERSAAEIEAWLAARIADRLGLRVSAVDVAQPFATIGLDSKKAVAILEELGAWLGRELTPGVLFDHPTVRDVAANLAGSRTESAAPGAGTTAEEPIAVVGLGCRFPGAPDVESYWRLLLDGRDAISEVPAERWDHDAVNAPRFGGFVDHVGDFDARFFGISAREAERMDPQQRLLLEIAWQTLEDAGIAPDRVAGSDTGVFVGISSHDYSERQLGDLDAIDVHAATGNAHSVAANRLSYLFDLSGPSLAVDTACSSSLTAIHLACRSLRAGECRMALAGGVNLLLTPALSVAFSAGQMLAEDGRCRTFDDAASGYVRGEGAGLACLKPLSAALADGDRIYAVVTGSGVGHGGRSNGLTAPKGSAQRAVIERALGQAGLRGDQIDYVEAHGTGTSLGDPIEWEALAGVYGRGRREDAPCLVGSVKSNIGHLEAAAGIAGFIKAALVVGRRRIPPQLHLQTPNRHLDWDGSGLEVPVRGRELPARDVTRAGVSSFGFGGMNAHAVLETAPPPARAGTAPERPAHAVCLSAHTPTALMTLARGYRAHLAAHPDVPLGDLAHAAATGRARLAHRAVLIAGSAGDLDASLDALVRGEPAKTVLRGHVSGRTAPRPAFLFSGQGTQYAGMGKAIFDAHPGFAATLERGDAVLRPLLGVSVLDVLFDEDGADRLRRTRYCQPALVAFEIALAELWMSLGVRPAAVLGHSVGAFGAACVAGVLSLEDALTLAATRGEHMDAQPGDGAMVACVGDAGTIRAAAESASVAVAAVNTPDHLVLSGPSARIRALRGELEACGVVVRSLTVSHAFHSELMAGAAEPLRKAAGAVAFGTPDIPWVSDATGEPVERVDAGYWVGHMLGTVRFADGFAALRRLGCDAFVEIGPHPTLLNLGRAMTAEGDAPLWLPSLRRGGRDWETFLQSLGRLHCAGGEVDWPALDAGHRRARVAVPHAVFERQPYWFAANGDPATATATATATAPAIDANGGQRMENGVNSNGSHPAAHNGVAPNGHHAPAGGAVATGPSAEVLRHVVGQVSRVCGFPVDQIPADAHVGTDLGLDSLMKAELERLLAGRFPDRVTGLRERLSEDFTVGELAAALDDGTAPSAPPPAPTQHARPPAQPSAQPPAYGQPQPMPYPPQQPYGPMGYWPPQPYAPGPQPMPYPPQQPYAPPQYVQQPPPPATPQPPPAEPERPPVKRELEFEGWEEHEELQGRIRQIESSGANAYGRVHEGFNSARISMDGRAVINFSAFNYLALSAHPRLCAAAKAAIDRYGTSASATPLLCGETPLHHELDAEIAGFLGTEAAIVFAGGHATNVATVGHLFGPEDLILHDEWIHDSTVRGTLLSGAKRRPFPHNDWAALDKVLTAMRDRYRRAVVVIEGAYSQDGDIPDLPKFIEVKKRHDAMLMIDEAHSIGVLGRTGRGIGEHWGVDRADVDLWMGTLSKALGSLGGYIAARQPLIQHMKYTTPLFIFSTGISPANAAAALEAFRVIRDEPERVARVQELSDFFRAAARARGLDTGVSRHTAVIPIILGSWERAMTVSNELLAQGVNVMPIGYPAVAKDKCRLRFFINVDHREEDLEHSLDLLGQAMGTTPKQHDDATAPRSTARPARSKSRRGGADVLVAGASGFIGGHLTRRLVEHGHSVRVLVREGSDRSAFDDLPVDVEVGSLTDVESLRRATAGVRHVYNTTGKSADWGAWSEFEQVNVYGSRNLVEAAAEAGTVERFLHVSTTDVYGYPVRPCDESAGLNDIGLPYNRSKVLGERAVTRAAERAGLPYTIVRPVSVYGPRSKDFVIEMATLLLAKQMVYVRKGRAPAGLLYVGNAADAMIAACTSDATIGRAYNLRDPELTTWREYLEALASGLGVKPPSISLPSAVATGVASASEKVYGSLRVKSRPVLTRHAVHLLNRDQSYSIDRARDDFGFKSEVSFEEGMRHTIDWLDSAEGRRLVSR